MKKLSWVKRHGVPTFLILTVSIATPFSFTIEIDKEKRRNIVWADWTGFGADPTVNIERNKRQEIIKTIEIQQSGKTLWDWLNLLGVPLVLAVLGYWYQHIEKKREKDRLDFEKSLEANRQKQLQDFSKGLRQDEILKNYFESMKDLLLDKGLRDSENEYDEIRTVARILTLTVLRQLDHTRNKLVIQFLRESRLIYVKESIPGQEIKFEENSGSPILSFASAHLSGADLNRVNLSGADLKRIDLSEANLGNVKFSKASLRGANLSKTDLSRADLRDSDLEHTDLSGADLSGAYLINACLNAANLSGAYLVNACLRGADLRNVNLSGAYLRNVNFSSATYDDNTTLPSGFDPKLNRMVKVMIVEAL